MCISECACDCHYVLSVSASQSTFCADDVGFIHYFPRRDKRLKSQGIYTHTYTYITWTRRERKTRERISLAGRLTLCILQRAREIGIGVCFCSDMDEEPQSTDQSADMRRERGREGSHEGMGKKEGARQRRVSGEIRIRTWKLFSCVLS